MKSFFVYLSILMWVSVKAPWLAMLLCVYFVITKSIPQKVLFGILFALFLLRTNIQVCQPIDHGRVVRLNKSSVMVQQGFTKVMVQVQDVAMYAMHDHIKLYALRPLEVNMNQDGFDPMDWSKANGICYRSSEADSFRTEGKGWIHHLSTGGFNQDKQFVQEMRALLFQSDPDDVHQLWVSMGLVYLAILDVIRRLCIHFKSIWVERCISLLILLSLCVSLGMPLVLIRILVTYAVGMFVEDRMLKWALSIFICLWLVPYGSTQLAYIFPFSLQAVPLFVDKQTVKWSRLCVAFWCLLISMKRVSLLGIVLFPINRVLNLVLMLMGFLSTFIPFIHKIFSYLYLGMDRWFVSTQDMFVVRGRGSILLIMFVIYVLHRLRNKHFGLSIMALCITNILMVLVSYPWFYTVSMLYVGQGDAILLQAPFNQSVLLIDTGPPSQYANLKASLDHRGIHTLDYLIITHDDADHNGNVETLHQGFVIKKLVKIGGDIQNEWFYLKHLPIQEAKEDNDLSLVYQVQLESSSFLFMGDLGTAGELQLIKANPDLKSDVLKLGHHGSKTSSSLAFLNHVQARIALISAGKNTYGHPSWEVMERLKRLAIRSVVSQNSGTVQIVITPWFRFMFNRFNLFTLF